MHSYHNWLFLLKTLKERKKTLALESSLAEPKLNLLSSVWPSQKAESAAISRANQHLWAFCLPARRIHILSPGGRNDFPFCSWGNWLSLISDLANLISGRFHSLCTTPWSWVCFCECDIKDYWVWSREILVRGGCLFWQA